MSKVLLRLLVISLISAPFVILFALKFKLSVAVLLTIKTAICLCIGFVLFGTTHYFFDKFNLLNKDFTISNNYANEREMQLLDNESGPGNTH